MSRVVAKYCELGFEDMELEVSETSLYLCLSRPQHRDLG